MFKKILVPLDGSKLAECALDYAEELARNCSATEIVLVSVTERVVARTQAPEIKEMYTSSAEDRIGGSGSSATSMLRGAVTQAGDVPGVRPLVGASSGENMIIDGSRGATVVLGKLERQAYNYLNKIAKKLKAKGLYVTGLSRHDISTEKKSTQSSTLKEWYNKAEEYFSSLPCLPGALPPGQATRGFRRP